MVSFRGISLNKDLPVYIQLLKYIKIQIHIGNFENGEELPSRRELAGQLGINPNTVQKAYKQLESEGLLNTLNNVKSVLIVNDEIKRNISRELTSEATSEFIAYAKSLNLSFKDTVELITELWD